MLMLGPRKKKNLTKNALRLLICTLRSDFPAGRKLGFFSGSPTRKKIGVCRTTFFQPENQF